VPIRQLSVEDYFGRKPLKSAFDADELALYNVQVTSPDGAELGAACDAGTPVADPTGQAADFTTPKVNGGGFDVGREICGWQDSHSLSIVIHLGR